MTYHVGLVAAIAAVRTVRLERTALVECAIGGRADVCGGSEAEGGESDQESRGELHDCCRVVGW